MEIALRKQISMVIASIVPYESGYLGIAVTDCDDLLVCDSFEVGHLEDLAVKIQGKDKRRIVDRSELLELSSAVSRMVEDAEEIHVQDSAKPSGIAYQVASAIKTELRSHGREVKSIPASWRSRLGEYVIERRPAALAIASRRFPEQEFVGATALAVAMITEKGEEHDARDEGHPVPVLDDGRDRNVEPEAPERIPGPETERSGDCEEGSGEVVPDQTERVETTTRPGVIRDSEASSRIEVTGPIVAGIDPGSRKLALVIASGDKAPLIPILVETIKVGSEVPLPKPRTVTLKDGSERIITTKLVFTDADVDRDADLVVAKLVEHGVTKLTIEHVYNFHMPSDVTAQAACSNATQVIRAIWLAVTIAERAQCDGIEVRRVGASTWRARVAGRAKRGGEGTELIPDAVRAGFANWDDSNEHERDAAGICLFGVLPPKIVVKRGPKEKKAPAERRERSRKKERDPRCTCPAWASQHTQLCPCYIPRTFVRKPKS